MFHHVFVKNYLANSPDAARFRTVLKERVGVLGKGVLTNMCAFILENGELFEKSGDALFGLIQLIDEVDKEVAISGEKSRQNMNKVLEDILAKYPAMQTSWDSRITKQASDMVEAAIKNQLNEDTFCENVQTLRTSTNLVDGYVFSAFLKKLLAVFSSYLAGTKTDTSVVLKCSDIIGILVKHRLLQEREQEFLASLVSVVASAPYAALAIVLPALHNQIGGVLQDYPTLSKDFYSNATVRAVLAKYSTLSTPVIQPSLSDSYLSSSLRGAKSVGAYSEVGGITPSLSHFTINVSYDDALSPLLTDCPPLSETQCAAVKRLLNRMGGNNVDTVSEKLFSLFTPTQIPSFVQFFVQDYVCFQSIHMETYLNLVLMRNDESFVSLVLDASILSALRLLKDDSESTRNSLRAVGSFIGSITLARNRVLPLRKLNLSALVEKSREEGAVHNTIVLVTSILLQADNSIVFRSVRQPWLRSVLRVLCVLHEDPNIPVTEKKQYVPWLLSKLNVSDEECEELKAEALNSLHARVTPALYSTLSTPLPSERVFPSPQLQRSLPSSSTPRMPAYYPQSPMPPSKDDFISFAPLSAPAQRPLRAARSAAGPVSAAGARPAEQRHVGRDGGEPAHRGVLHGVGGDGAAVHQVLRPHPVPQRVQDAGLGRAVDAAYHELVLRGGRDEEQERGVLQHRDAVQQQPEREAVAGGHEGGGGLREGRAVEAAVAGVRHHGERGHEGCAVRRGD